MARNNKLSPGIQVFRGSRPRQDVFTASLGAGCCGTGGSPDYDKLAERTRFDNALAHSNPTGANDKFFFPYGNGFQNTRDEIIRGINDEGVGYHISVLAIPTYAFVTGVAIHVSGYETGLTFDIVTRNGLVLPADCAYMIEAERQDDCEIQRTLTDLNDGGEFEYEGIGDLDGNDFIDYVARAEGCGEFSLEADEIAFKVATMPASGVVTGDFAINIAVSYEVIHRAEA